MRQNLNANNQLRFSQDPTSASFLMLYKKGLAQLTKDEFVNNDDKKLRNLELELQRTEGLTIDETLKHFAADNKGIVQNLMKMN